MPKALSSVNDVWVAFHEISSAIREELKDMLTGGGGGGGCVDADETRSSINIIPQVTAMGREYARDILKACASPLFTGKSTKNSVANGLVGGRPTAFLAYFRVWGLSSFRELL